MANRKSRLGESTRMSISPHSPVPSISANVRALLDSQFQNASDLSGAPNLLTKLKEDEKNAGDESRSLKVKLAERGSKAASYALDISSSLCNLVSKIEHRQRANVPALHLVEGAGSTPFVHRQVTSRHSEGLIQEVSGLAKEVVRVEQFRMYTEKVLQLEQLVGDLEDAVTATTSISRDRRFVVRLTVSQEYVERLLEAVKTYESVEDLVGWIATTRPEWRQLIGAVELRVRRAASSLRSAAIAEYRSLVAILGWPPLLSPSGEQESQKESRNPFLDTEDSISLRFRDCSLVLSILQAVQQHQIQRQRGGKMTQKEPSDDLVEDLVHEPLWIMEELITPFASRSQYHFRKWSQRPELVCALAYTMCQEYVDLIDESLQPIVDKARLTGYSAREEWVFCLMAVVADHFRTHILPGLVDVIQEQAGPSGPAAALWLHSADQVLGFDTRMRSLAVQASGIQGDADIHERIGDAPGIVLSCIGVFSERPDWLKVWAEVEFADAWEKLRLALDKEEAWVVKQGIGGISQSALSSSRVPSGAEAVLASMWAVIDRCRTLPEAEERLNFVKEGATPIAKTYHGELLQRCEQAEGLVDLAKETEMVKVAVCINAARFCESKLQEWAEDIFFLELRVAELCAEIKEGLDVNLDFEVFELNRVVALEGTIFDKEINQFAHFRKHWVGSLVAVVVRRFETLCQNYFYSTIAGLLNRNGSIQGQPESSSSERRDHLLVDAGVDMKAMSISASFVDALVVLQGQLRALNKALQEENFIDFWRDLTIRLDQLFVNTLPLTLATFSRTGAQQLIVDIHALFQVFKPFCVRPASFFKGLSIALKVAQSCVN